MFSFFDTFLISFHDDSDKNVLNGSIEEYHKKYKVELTRKSFSPGLKEGIVDYITVEKGEKSNY